MRVGRDQWQTPLRQMQAELGASKPLDRSPEVFRRAMLDNVEALFNHIDRAALDRVIQTLADARNVLVAGGHEDRLSALNLYFCALKWFRHWSLVVPGHSDSNYLMAGLTSADAFVIVATSPYDCNVLQVASDARQARSRVIGITDTPESHLAPYAHEVLIVPVPDPCVFKSNVAMSGLVEMLVPMVAARSVAPPDRQS